MLLLPLLKVDARVSRICFCKPSGLHGVHHGHLCGELVSCGTFSECGTLYITVISSFLLFFQRFQKSPPRIRSTQIFDYGTLAFLMWNFAIGGVVAVFWQKGVPRIVTQGYLVAVRVLA
jgi:hypothetical protein